MPAARGHPGFGASGINPSAEISLEINSGNPGWSGFYTNGNIGGGSASTSPVNFFSGDPINVTLTYNGSVLHENLLDTVTAASYDASYVTNLPSILGRSDVFVGITASSGDVNCHAAQEFSNFHFTSSVPEPSTLVLLGLGAIGLLGLRLAKARGWLIASSRNQSTKSIEPSVFLRVASFVWWHLLSWRVSDIAVRFPGESAGRREAANHRQY